MRSVGSGRRRARAFSSSARAPLGRGARSSGSGPRPERYRITIAIEPLRARVRAAQLLPGAAQLAAQLQALNPSASGSGADGAPNTLLLESTSCISSEG